MFDCLVFILLLLLLFFFSCNYFTQGEITTLGPGGGPDIDIIWDVVVGMVETQLYFFSGNNLVALSLVYLDIL